MVANVETRETMYTADGDVFNKQIHPEEDDKRNETLPVSYSEDQSTAKTYEDLARYVI